jgi:hypothetical protein
MLKTLPFDTKFPSEINYCVELIFIFRGTCSDRQVFKWHSGNFSEGRLHIGGCLRGRTNRFPPSQDPLMRARCIQHAVERLSGRQEQRRRVSRGVMIAGNASDVLAGAERECCVSEFLIRLAAFNDVLARCKLVVAIGNSSSAFPENPIFVSPQNCSISPAYYPSDAAIRRMPLFILSVGFSAAVVARLAERLALFAGGRWFESP